MKAEDSAVRLFSDRFGGTPEFVVRAPGRVNLMGDHTDYNGGFVLPMAVDLATWIAGRSRSDATVMLSSDGFGDAVLSLEDLDHGEPPWSEYVRGVAWALGPERLSGWEGAVTSELPIGAGLSSSAALELAAARSFAAVSAIDWDPLEMALDAQRAENDWVGMACGIMDQLSSAAGVEGHALLIDCRSLAIRATPLPPSVAVVVLDTRTRRRLVDSAYNERRQVCERSARALGVAALRDLDESVLSDSRLDELARRRVRHVLSENRRTVEAAEAMQAGDIDRLGMLMGESHASLRDDYEVSSPELDAMVEAAQATPGCVSARMTGAGFGGCAVALVHEAEVASFVEPALDGYRGATRRTGAAYVTMAVAGAELVPL